MIRQAKQVLELIKENNYKRLIYLYFKLMQCNLHFNNYIECYEISRQVILMCKSFNMDGYELETSKKIFAVGGIKAARFLIGQEVGFYTMDDVLFND